MEGFPACDGHKEIVTILVSLTDNPIAPDNNVQTPIYQAAYHGHTEIVKITYNLTAADKFGDTPIYQEAHMGHSEIVKILVPLTDNPNAPNKNTETPIYIGQIVMVIQKLSKY